MNCTTHGHVPWVSWFIEPAMWVFLSFWRPLSPFTPLSSHWADSVVSLQQPPSFSWKAFRGNPSFLKLGVIWGEAEGSESIKLWKSECQAQNPEGLCPGEPHLLFLTDLICWAGWRERRRGNERGRDRESCVGAGVEEEEHTLESYQEAVFFLC